MKQEHTLPTGRDELIQRHVSGISCTVRLPDQSECEGECQFGRKRRLFWHTDGSETDDDTGARVYGYGTYSLSLAEFTAVFWEEEVCH
jgi:hypothetical protein